MFSIKLFIKEGFFMSNKKIICYYHFNVKLYSIIRLSSVFFEPFFRYLILKKIKNKLILFNVPRFISVSYKLLLFFMTRKPKIKELYYPINVDLFKASDKVWYRY